MASVPESGRLDAHPLPRLLLELRAARFAGTLHLSRERVEKRVLFREGAPVFAESNVPSETLGVQLMDAGQITRADHARASQLVQERGIKEGAALLELGLLSPKDLFLALKEQARRRIVECFGWPAGEFRTEPGEALPADVQPLRLDPLALVQDGLERHWPPDRVLAQLAPKLELCPAPAKGLAALRSRLRLDGGLGALFDALDGRTALSGLLQHAATPAALAGLWLADAAGALEYRKAPRDADGGEKDDSEPELEIVFEDEPPRPGAGAPSAAAARKKRGPDAGLDALRSEVRERHRRLAELDYYGVLGVAREADGAAIKRAYFAAAKRYHPDALASLGLEDVRTEATALFARIAKAYATLSDPRSRQGYDQELEGHVAADADRLANAEALFRKGEILLRAGDFRGALQFLRPAVQLWPDDAAYRSALGWALFKKTPPEPEAAREELEKALALAEAEATAHFRLSVVLRALGDAAGSERHAKRARELNPKVSGR